MNYLKMLLSNEKRLKIQGIIKRIAQDKSITLEERIYVEKFAGFWILRDIELIT